MLFRHSFLVLVFFVHFVISNIKHTTTQQLTSTDDIPQAPSNGLQASNAVTYPEKICTDIDVRNYVSNLEVLRGCTVVEGYVQINLIDNSTAQDFSNYSYPELKEITEYLSFYHVSGLKSISQLFPNLAIIRGNTFSVTDYSFAVFSMFNLQDIGLWKLTHIMKGAVMILRNPGLCFVHTVNWTAIASKSYVHINDIKSQEACELIYESKAKVKNCEFYWSNENCQLTHKECHKLCAGGCSGPSANDCFACTGFVHENQCLEKCPPGLLSYMNRRCLTREECLNNKRDVMKNFPINMKMSYAENAKWRPFQDACIDECPPGYNTTADETSCVACPDCPKVCGGIAVKSIEQCHSIKGCTVINGSLEIQIQTGDSEVVHEELEKGLGLITNITGHLKISHSLPIQSLNFFKSLRSIHGEITANTPESLLYSNYSLIVWDNPNLQELWNWSAIETNARGQPNFEIRKGKILFHDNPKLCMDKIHELMRITNITPDSNFDIPKESNGVEFICGSSNLTLQILDKTDVSLRFKLIESQSRANVNQHSYVLFYVKEENGIYTKYDTVGNCEASGWKFKEMDHRNKIAKITELEPATKYAVFVKIYDDDKIVRSNIIFQSTLPSRPSIPYQLEVTQANSSSITLSWAHPKHPHGELEKYIIKAYYQDYDVNYLDTRNYCDNKLRDLSESTHSSSILRLIKSKPKECCGKLLCDFDHENLQYLTTQMQLIQQCDNYLLKFAQFYDLNNSMFDMSPSVNFSRVPDKTGLVMFPETSFTMTNLRHFRNIMFSVSACRKKEENRFLPHDSDINRCSEETMVIGKTDLDPMADRIPSESFEIITVNQTLLQIRWRPPSYPNGIVVAYNIEFKREQGNTDHMCRTRREIEKDGLDLNDFPPGSYELRVRAVSLAGEGPWTKWKHCTIHSSDVDKSLLYTVVFIVLIIACSMLGMVIYLIYRQRKIMKERENGGSLWVSVNPEYVKVPYVADEWEVERDDVELRGILGKGTFGIVHEGFIKSKNLKCAVKTIMDTANDRDRMDFLKEASTMKTFSSAHNIVGLIGVVSKGHPPYILIEYMGLHDLKTFLRNTRDSDKTPPPPSLILIKMAAQIADGMEYMEARKFVHCDLAARNCMVAEDLSVKIGDLGMSRDVFQQDYYRKGGKGLMPVRWMAPESIRDGVFTSFSDVWSYGIVLWEMAMLAEQPYQGLSNEEVIKFVKSGRTLSNLSIPQICPEILRKVMLQAWAWRPSSRPTFHQIVSLCEEYLDDKFRSTSFHHSEECIQLQEANAASMSSRRLLETSESDPVVSYHKESYDSSGSDSANAVNIDHR